MPLGGSQAPPLARKIPRLLHGLFCPTPHTPQTLSHFHGASWAGASPPPHQPGRSSSDPEQQGAWEGDQRGLAPVSCQDLRFPHHAGDPHPCCSSVDRWVGQLKIGLAWLLGPQAGPSLILSGLQRSWASNPWGPPNLEGSHPPGCRTNPPQLGWAWGVSPCTRPSSKSHPDMGQARGGGLLLHKSHTGEASRNQKHMARPAQCPHVPASRPQAAHPQSRVEAGIPRPHHTPSCPYPLSATGQAAPAQSLHCPARRAGLLRSEAHASSLVLTA